MSFRLDRMASIYFFAPLRKLTPNKKFGIPILMYHSVTWEEDGYLHPYYRTNTTPEMFARQMRFLSEAGYRVISLDELGRNLTQNNSSSKYIVLTFDDGFRDFLDEAFPILKKYCFTATVFLPTGFIGGTFSPLKNKQCLSWDDVRDLYTKGIRFGSHSVNHPQLRLLDKYAIETEIINSKNMIEDMIGKTIKSFSYPYAFPEEDREFTSYLKSILLKSGYTHGVSTIIGIASEKEDAFFLSRLPINSGDDIPFFRAKLEGGYDWLHKPQYVVKKVRKTLKKALHQISKT
jgi:peptidoglycan/xylan/chitin deacetylase (PgdA/CDA1 family)